MESESPLFGLVATQARVFPWASHVGKELQTDFTEAEKQQQQSHVSACGPVALLHFPLAACCESGIAQAKPSILRFFLKESSSWFCERTTERGELAARVQEAPAELLNANPIFNVQWVASSYKTVHMV